MATSDSVEFNSSREREKENEGFVARGKDGEASASFALRHL